MADSSQRTLLSDRAYDDIRSRILDCVIAPGEFVSERALAQQLDHGIAATRAALARLASDGLVTSIPRVGYQVAPITLRGVTAFFETWAIIGPPFVGLGMSRLTPAQRREIESLPALAPNYTAREAVEYADAFFRILAEAVDNALLAEIFRRLQGDMHRIFTLAYWDTTTHGDSAPLQPVLADFDPATAERQAAAFIEHARRHTMNWVTTSTSLADVALSFR
ncbi:GntR family transcriptional regulator [Microbacterium hominis]|uniref:GntR family transcriptional regulator n=1 Tax=Microbacterium hominis TaxID=162426 RepID=UPI0007685747|nr:GntR family transcriptional regulator [Microbacterium hominis]KXC06262.1 hypothetical protein MhomT_06530 [Microbacterium hominis]